MKTFSLILALIGSFPILAQSSFLSSWKISGGEVKWQSHEERILNNSGGYTFEDLQIRLADPDNIPSDYPLENASFYLDSGVTYVSFTLRGGLILTKSKAENTGKKWSQHLHPKLRFTNTTIGYYFHGEAPDEGEDTINLSGFRYAEKANLLGLEVGYRFHFQAGKKVFFFGEGLIQADVPVKNTIEQTPMEGEWRNTGHYPIDQERNLVFGKSDTEKTQNLEASFMSYSGAALELGAGLRVISRLDVFLSYSQGLHLQTSWGNGSILRRRFNFGCGVAYRV